jgi:alpha-beta hydrolase superfamily lysophospholipase
MDHAIDHLSFVDLNGHKIATAFHAAPNKKVVICCHGFISSRIGPNRFFVRLARQLQQQGICALRFDQYGSGDSEGDFFDSSFNDWIATTKAFVHRYRESGYQVALLGQSMGGTAVLAVAGDLGPGVASVVAWVPDPSVDPIPAGDDWIEEGGQRVRLSYWHEAHDADIVGRFRAITAPTLVFFATADDYVSAENRQAVSDARREHQRIELLEGWPHSAWTYDQATQVITQSVAFLTSHFD